MNYDQQPKPSRYSINNLFLAIMSIFVALLMIGVITELAFAGTKQVQVGTIVGHKFSFQEVPSGEGSLVSIATEIIKDVDPATCVAEASGLQDIYRQAETSQAADFGQVGWVVKSSAFCTLVDKTVDYPDGTGGTVTVEGVCEILYDPNNQATARQQLIAQCLS